MFNSKREDSTESGITTNSYIGQGTVVQGNVISEGSLRLEGKIVGDVEARSKLFIAAGSLVQGNVVSKTAEISGAIEGNVVIDELLVLKAEAVIQGDIQTQRLVVEAGARFDGVCNMQTNHTDALAAVSEVVVEKITG